MTTARYCTFEVGSLLVGVEVDHVSEILVDPEVTPVPLAPAGIVGLLSRRGEIVTVLDAHHRLGVAPVPGSPARTHVIIGLDGETASLPVDEQGDVIEIDSGRVHSVPGTVAPTLRRLLDGIVELDDGRLMLALRAERAAGVLGA